MSKNKTLKDFGYPSEGIIDIDRGGGDSYECPQEAFSAHTCGSCRKFTKDWTCGITGEDKEPDYDTCDDIDYIEKWVGDEFGFRDPVRCEYSTDEAYEQACKAINAINRDIKAESEHQYNILKYGKNYWVDEDEYVRDDE